MLPRPLLPLLVAGVVLAGAFRPASARAEDDAPAATPRSIQDILAEREERRVMYEGLEKSEPLAALLSAVPGFGAGCFYGGSPDVGWAFFGTELGLLTVTGLTSSNVTLTSIQAEGVIFGLLKAAELVTCTIETSAYNDDLQRAMESGDRRRGLTLAPGLDPVHPSLVAGYTFHF